MVFRVLLPRHRASTEILATGTVLSLHEPDDSLHAADTTVTHAGSRWKIPECIDELLPSLKKLLKRVVKDGIAKLHSLVKLIKVDGRNSRQGSISLLTIFELDQYGVPSKDTVGNETA